MQDYRDSTEFQGGLRQPLITIKSLEEGNPVTTDTILPETNLADAKWRSYCLSKDAVSDGYRYLASGYTYLSQLLGHDLGNSVRADDIPYELKPGDKPSKDVLYGFYNLFEAPCSLETIYGRGPAALPHLYETRTLRFRIRPDQTLSEKISLPSDPSAFPDGSTPMRLLADIRNRDTPMLHELAVIWMQFHNIVFNELVAEVLPDKDPAEYGSLNRSFLFENFVRTRSILIGVWHRILKDDLLEQLCHPAVYAMPDDDIEKLAPLSVVNVLHGLMRAFHVMPLDAYHMRDTDPIDLSSLRRQSNEDDWDIDWTNFFGPDATNLTRICASYATQFSGRG
ncbi:MAG: hypothetical protein WBB25_20025, partial [Sulfitobacter sp.]